MKSTSRNKTKSSRASKLFCIFALILIVYIVVMAVIILGNKNPVDIIDGISFSSEHVSRFNHVKNDQQYPILPKRVYTVVGKESSGTKFVTAMIRDALKLHSYREGVREYEFFRKKNRRTFVSDSNSPVQVEHFSLPQGGICRKHNMNNHTILDAALPPHCSSTRLLFGRYNKMKKVGGQIDMGDVKQQCDDLQKGLNWNVLHASKLKGYIQYPGRFFLDISTYKDWYERHGVEHYIVIVTRDKTASLTARSHKHCRIPDVAENEEQLATAIINDAIYKYILEEERPRETNLKYVWDPQKYRKQKPENAHRIRMDMMKRKRIKMLERNNIPLSQEQKQLIRKKKDMKSGEMEKKRRRLEMKSALIPNNNRVVLVSYETLMSLKDPYIKTLYKQLDIESDFIPEVKDGNAKYVKKAEEINRQKDAEGEFSYYEKRAEEDVDGEKDDWDQLDAI